MYFVGVFGDFAAAIGASGSQMRGMASLDLDEGRTGLGRNSGQPQHDFLLHSKDVRVKVSILGVFWVIFEFK